MSTVYCLPRTYTAAQLVYAVRFVKSHPDARFSTPDGDNLTADQYLAWFRKCLHVKITNAANHARYGLAPLTWRKLQHLYQTELRRDAWRLQGPIGDHIHWFVDGTHKLCGDRQCEGRH